MKTDLERWSKTSKEVASWGDRNKHIAKLIPDDSSVLDIGAGNMAIQELIPKTCTYQPLDCVQGRDDTIVYNFNEDDKVPSIGEYDVIVCSGVMEYIENPNRFLKILKGWGSKIIMSYAVTDYTPSPEARKNSGWFNHLSREELFKMISNLGMAVISESRWGSQIIIEIDSLVETTEDEPIEDKPASEVNVATKSKQVAGVEIDLEKYNHECYIVGGGPSLKDFDWTLLDDKFTIALNMAHIVLPKADIIYCTDPPWIAPNAPTLSAHKAPVWQGVLNLNNPPKLPCVDKQWHLTGRNGLATAPGTMSHGSNSAYAATNLAAVHLGFKKIYLLGIDLKWKVKGNRNTSHWHSDTKPHARIDSEAIYTTMQRNFDTIKQPLKLMGVEVISVNTPEGTDLRAFPIKSKEEVFGL